MINHSIPEYIHSLVNSHRLGPQVAAHRYAKGQQPGKIAAAKAVPEALGSMLKAIGIETLYEHQVQAIESIRKGNHTVVATPTASGKSLIYNLALLEKLLNDQHARGLYVFPLKALAQDQHKSFLQVARAAAPLDATAAIYDGDTSAYRRKKIRESHPSVVMTNPEMLHLAFLPYHRQWGAFFKDLELVVIDEVHTYRGVLGSHMAQVLRRLMRICGLYGAKPTFIFTSATVANPGELARQLCGFSVRTVQQSGASAGGRHLVLMDSYEGPAHTAILLLKAALARKLRTIVYTQSRKLAELITLWVQQRSGDWADKISVYRAGLLPEERRAIEMRLQSGELLAVVSTSALELGIDIGDLDICILVGYPGSMIATWQRSGRVGRKGQEAALVMVAGQDALDQYYLAQPRAFFEGRAEKAVINAYNPVVLEAHLICAASEYALNINEGWLAQPEVSACVANLTQKGELLRSHDSETLHARQRRPHRKVSLRAAGKRYRIMSGEQFIGEINGFSLYREAHPGAIYLHQGLTYMAGSVDEATSSVDVQPVEVVYHTRVRGDTDITIINQNMSKAIGKTVIYYGKVKVIDQVTGYEKMHTANGKNLGYVPLEVPPVVFETDAVWFELPPEICDDATHKNFDLTGSLHAAEHAAISIMPLLVLADRNDVGGMATPWHAQTHKATIFIYDGVPGGAGFSGLAYQKAPQLLTTAADVIGRCKCKSGCPACVHSPKCGSGNQPMDKKGAYFLLKNVARPGKTIPIKQINYPAEEKAVLKSEMPSNVLRYGVFDLETQRSAQEVGGWHMAHHMKVSCGVIYDQSNDQYSVYLENQVDALIEHLQQLDIVVGFNSKRFDYKVLSGYSDLDFNAMNSLDLLEQVYHRMGFRLSLDHLARETLGVQKAGSGLDALKWWRQGQIDKIITYCRKDVTITRDLYRYAREKGYLIYRQKDQGRFRIPLSLL